MSAPISAHTPPEARRGVGPLATAAVLLGAALLTLTPDARAADRLEPRPFSADPALADLPAKWSAQLKQFDVPGAAVGVVKDGAVYVQTFGVRNPDGGLPVTPDTMFYIASITKTFTAMGVCALAEDGRLDLDDRVKSHLPRFDLPDEHDEIEEKVTIRDLLCHRYGINSAPIVTLDAYTGEITDERYWRLLKHARVAGEPAYTNVNFTLAGKVIEKVAGMDWRDWLEQRIFQPAGMTRTTGYASRLYDDPNCAIPLEWTPDGFVPTEQRKTDRTMHAAGGLGISAADGARWIVLNLDDGRIGAERIVSGDLVRSMRDQHAATEPEGSIRVMDGFGLGWQTGEYAGVPLLAHGGGYVGTGAYVALHPEQKAGFFILVNAGGLARGWAQAVAVDCSKTLTGAAPPWSPWERFIPQAQRIHRERAEAMSADDADAEDALTVAYLSRPIGLYTGAFHNEMLGTLHVEREGDTLRLRLGDAPESAAPAESPDAFTIDGRFESGHFIIQPDGEIDEVRLLDDEYGEFTFRR